MKFWFKFLRWGQSRIEKGTRFLVPFSWIWGLISFLKNWCYDHGWFKSSCVACPVVSVGNLVAGGTGKTPLVHLLAKRFSHRRVAILSRGYGPDCDEPKILQRRLPSVKVYVGKDRVRLAKQAMQEGAELILLDDGFQYRRLHRDFDLVLLFGEDPLGKGYYLPGGFLRDSPKRLKKADLVLVNGPSSHLILFPYVSLRVKVDRILDFHHLQVKSLSGKRVALFSGIARPYCFRNTVESLGAIVAFEKQLADHEKISQRELEDFAMCAKSMQAEYIVCTEKDAIKLDAKIDLTLPLVFLEISLEVDRGQMVLDKLIAKIDQKIDTYKL